MENLLTMNPNTAAGAIGLAIDLTVIENSKINKEEAIRIMNKFTTCNTIDIITVGTFLRFQFRTPEETLQSLTSILDYCVKNEAKIEEELKYGFQWFKNGNIHYMIWS